MSLLYISVIINQMINICLTFHKKAYCEIRKVLEEVEISADDKVSISCKN